VVVGCAESATVVCASGEAAEGVEKSRKA
jgi:hypothetical protein